MIYGDVKPIEPTYALETSCQIVTDEIQKHDVFYNALLDGLRSTICEYGRGCEKEAYALAEKITLFLAGE